MDVARENFSTAYTDLENAVSSSTFISIDAEFTGLCKPGQEQKVYDTPAQVYEKIRQCAMAYNVIQYGVSVFQHHPEEDRYSVKTYNFNVNIRPYGQHDEHYGMQSSSIAFLAGQNMDFNKIFRDGISYLLPSHVDRLRQSMVERHQKRLNSAHSKTRKEPAAGTPLKTVPDNMKISVERNIARVKEMFEDDTDELDLDSGSNYLCRTVVEHINNKFNGQFHLSLIKEKDDRRTFVRVKRIRTVDDFSRLEKESQQLELNELDEAFGFSKVVRLLYDSQKLIVGHNMYLDLLHTIHHFAHPLPEEYAEFKQLAHTLFPRLADTKHIASSEAFKELLPNTALSDLHKDLQKTPFAKLNVAVADGFDLYTDNERLHEAGYDAYVTGLCFLSMINYLGNNAPVTAESPVLSCYINRLHIMRLPDVRFMNVGGDDDAMSRNHVFHVAFNKETNGTDLRDLFSPFSGVRVEWLNDTSAFVAVNRKEKAEEAKREFRKKKASLNGFVVRTYDDFALSEKLNRAPVLSLVKTEKDWRESPTCGAANTSGASAPPLRRISEPMIVGSPVSTPVALLPVPLFPNPEPHIAHAEQDMGIKQCRITKDKKSKDDNSGPVMKKVRILDDPLVTPPAVLLQKLFFEPSDW